MKIQSIQKCLSWTAAHLAWSVMAFSPVALGKEASNVATAMSQKELKAYLQEAGLTKKSTLGEFWAKTKAEYPDFVQKDLEQFVARNKNRQMPDVTVGSAKATDGSTIATLQVVENGKVNTVQFFGEKNKWAKINNVVLSEYDFKRVADVFSRLESSDIKLRKESDKYRDSLSVTKKDSAAQMSKDLSRFAGFPTMTPQLWKSFSMKERAAFIVTMRLMHTTAQKVLNSDAKEAAKQGAAIENFYRAIFQDANAQKSKFSRDGSQSNQASKVGDQCVVAGYIGTYELIENTKKKKSLACSVDKGIAGYLAKSGFEFVKKATDTCSSSKGADSVACNPIIFGYPSSGQPACINKYTTDFSNATTSCDGQSRLTKGKLADMPGGDKKYVGIKPREAQLQAIEDDQLKDNYLLTEKFLEGVLASKEPAMLKAFKDGVWSQELEQMLSGIQSGFKGEIESAIGICEQRIKNNPTQADPQQKDACDQLHRRWLFTEFFILKLRKKACDPAATYRGSFDRNKLDALPKKVCECNDTKVMVGLGEKCAPAAAVPPALPPVEERVGTPVACAGQYPGVSRADLNEDCLCHATNKAPSEVAQASTNSMESSYPDDLTTKDPTYTCKEMKFPWLLAGGAGLLALLLFRKKNKSVTPEAVVPPVQPAPMCAPKVGIPPNCTCAPCADITMELKDSATCQCGPRAVTPIPVVCENGTTALTAALCPPPVPPVTPPATNEGGTGNNCPAGGCSGGVN